MTAQRIHATTIAIDGAAVLLLGASGSGKSDFALRLIDRGAMLVSDDYTVLSARDGRLFAAPPDRIAGKIEARGLGILPLPHSADVAIAMAVELDAPVVRMPDAGATIAWLDIAVPLLALAPFEASAPIKLELALRRVRETG